MSATYEFMVDWDGDGVFGAVGDDVTDRVLDRGAGFFARYGRDQARAFSPIAPGQAGLEIDNSSRDYSPENASSPLAGKVLPGRRIRARATLGGTTYGLFRGFLDDYEVLPDVEQRSVQITCMDGLERLRGIQLSTPLYRGIRSGEAVGRLLDAIGWPSSDRDLDVGASTFPFWIEDGTDALSALQRILDSEGGAALATIDENNYFIYRDRHHRLIRSASKVSQATFHSDNEPAISPPVRYDQGWKEIANIVRFEQPIRTIGTLAVVWQTAATYAIADGQTIEIPANASAPFLDAVTPVAGVDYVLRSGTVTTALSRTAAQSLSVFVTAVGGLAVIDGMAVRAYPVSSASNTVVYAEDSTSRAKYGSQPWPSGRSPVWASLNDALAIAELILAARAERLPTMTITIRGQGNDVRLLQQLARDLSDRVRLTEPETGLDGDFWIEQIQHSISGATGHVTTFGLEKVPGVPTNLFRFDTTGAGFDDGRFAGRIADDPTTIWIWDNPSQGKFDTGLFAT